MSDSFTDSFELHPNPLTQAQIRQNWARAQANLTTVTSTYVSATSEFGTDNLVLRSDGVSRGAQASVVTLSDLGAFSGVASIEGGFVINELGADVDLRIEGDTAISLFVIDAGLDAVQIGTTTAGVIADFRSTVVRFNSTFADQDFIVSGSLSGASNLFVCDAGNQAVQIGTGTAGRIADFRASAVVFNEFGADQDFRAEGDTLTHLLMVDAGLDAVQIGTTVAGEIADFRSTSIVLNDSGADRDTLIEGDTATHLLVVDAGLDAVQIGTTSAGNIADFRSTGAVLNEDGSDRDFRVEGDSLPYMIFVDATSTTENIALITSAAPNWQTMDGGLFIGDVSTEPTGNPSSGGFLWMESGILNSRSSAGVLKNLVPAPDIQVFTTTGSNTWTKPTGAVTVIRHVIGAGGGGGSGQRDDPGTSRGGGGGGGGGGYSTDSNPATEFGTSETVTVGAGGAGGANNASDDTPGNDGTAGGNSSMTATGTGGATLTANGGGAGLKGTGGSGGAGGSGGTGDTENGGAGGAGASNSANAVVGGSSTGRMSGAGGGGGGGATTADLTAFSSAGGGSGGLAGERGVEQNVGTAGIICGFPGTKGGNASAYIAGYTPKEFGGGGGGGGGGTHGGAAASALGFGASGGLYGGGGGGGCAVTDTTTTAFNAGGAGRNGVVIVVTLFE